MDSEMGTTLGKKIFTFNSLYSVTKMHFFFFKICDSKTLTGTFYLDHFLLEYLQMPNRVRLQRQHLKDE